jgi:hypothetical protein
VGEQYGRTLEKDFLCKGYFLYVVILLSVYLTCSCFFFVFFCQRKRKAKLKSDGQVNGVDPLVEDDDVRLKEIGRYFEEKYVSIVCV